MWITCFEFRQKATEISDERIIIAFEAGKPHTQSVSEVKCKHLPNPAMPQDYSGQNLRGHSFKGQDLTGNLFWQNSQPGLALPKVSLEFSKTE
jgi:hypothetical protein